MSFVWSSLKKGDVPKARDVNEIREKMEDILDSLDKGLHWPYSVFAREYDMYEYKKFDALRQSIDELDAIKCNDCSSFNSYEKAAACPLAKMGYCSTDFQANYVTENSSENFTNNGTYNSDELAANNSGVDNQVFSGENTTVYAFDDGMDDSAEYYTAKTSENDTVNSAAGSCTADDSVVYSDYDSSVYSGECSTYCNGVYASENAIYYGGVDTGNNSGVDASYNSSFYLGDDSSYNNGVYDTHYANEHNDYGAQADSTVHLSFYVGDDSGYNSVENSTYFSFDNDVHYKDERVSDGACSSDDVNYYNGYNGTVNGTDYNNENNTNRITEDDVDNYNYKGTNYVSVESSYNAGVNSNF